MAGTCKGFFRLILFLCFEGRLHWNSWKASKEKEKDRMELFFVYLTYTLFILFVLLQFWRGGGGLYLSHSDSLYLLTICPAICQSISLALDYLYPSIDLFTFLFTIVYHPLFVSPSVIIPDYLHCTLPLWPSIHSTYSKSTGIHATFTHSYREFYFLFRGGVIAV